MRTRAARRRYASSAVAAYSAPGTAASSALRRGPLAGPRACALLRLARWQAEGVHMASALASRIARGVVSGPPGCSVGGQRYLKRRQRAQAVPPAAARGAMLCVTHVRLRAGAAAPDKRWHRRKGRAEMSASVHEEDASACTVGRLPRPVHTEHAERLCGAPGGPAAPKLRPLRGRRGTRKQILVYDVRGRTGVLS